MFEHARPGPAEKRRVGVDHAIERLSPDTRGARLVSSNPAALNRLVNDDFIRELLEPFRLDGSTKMQVTRPRLQYATQAPVKEVLRRVHAHNPDLRRGLASAASRFRPDEPTEPAGALDGKHPASLAAS